MWSGAYLKSWSKTMDILALSSGESELGAVIRAAAEGLGMQSVLSDYGIDVKVKLLSDATAAIGMARRQGLGRVRHLATSDLWIQQRIRLGHLSVAKWPGKNNPADILTKHKSRDELSRLMEFLGLQVVPGRPEPAPPRSIGWNLSQVVAVKSEKRLLAAQSLEVPDVAALSPSGVRREIGEDPGGIAAATLSPGGDIGAGASEVQALRHPMWSDIVEGRELCPSRPVPDLTGRAARLWSVFDLHDGRTLFDAASHIGQGPDVRGFIEPGDPRPLLLITWISTSTC